MLTLLNKKDYIHRISKALNYGMLNTTVIIMCILDIFQTESSHTECFLVLPDILDSISLEANN